MKEFFGFGGYTREPEGYMSWQHLLFVGSLLLLMVIAASVTGSRMKNRDFRERNKVLILSAILIDGLEIFKITIECIRSKSADGLLLNLPLFLCSIQLIAIPLAAFTKGRIKEGALDFVCIFGVLGAVFGTVFAGQNYGSYPVLSFDNVISGITHSISGFTALYILISRMASLKKKNIYVTFSILTFFCVAAYIVNVIIDYNYMFLMAGDGTPYDILYGWVGGNKILYPLGVYLLFIGYIAAYYLVYYLIKRKKCSKKTA